MNEWFTKNGYFEVKAEHLQYFIDNNMTFLCVKVVPTLVEDHYKIVLQPTFDVKVAEVVAGQAPAVPLPNVTIDNPFIMPLVEQGGETQLNLSLTNHGLIAATQAHLVVEDNPNFILTPLIDQIGTIPAQSSLTIPVRIRARDGVLPGHTGLLVSPE